MIGHNRVKHIYICFNGKNKKSTDPKKFKIYLQNDLMQNQVVNVVVLERFGPQ
jgi:hypothetical protein